MNLKTGAFYWAQDVSAGNVKTELFCVSNFLAQKREM